MAHSKEESAAAAQTYYAEIWNLLQKANESLRLSMILLSMAVALNEKVPDNVVYGVAQNKLLCDRMQFLCLPASSTPKDQLN